jgi:hypothetical protein
MMIRSLTTALLLLLSPPALAADLSNGNGLHDFCSKPSASLECLAYIRGIAEGLREGMRQGVTITTMAIRKVDYESGKKGLAEVIANKQACQNFFTWDTPDGADYGQIKDIVLKWLRDHPEQRHLDSTMVVPRALAAAWPVDNCPIK